MKRSPSFVVLGCCVGTMLEKDTSSFHMPLLRRFMQ